MVCVVYQGKGGGGGGGWKCSQCGQKTYRRDKLCQACRASKRGGHNRLRPQRRICGKTPPSSAKLGMAKLPLARPKWLKQPIGAKEELEASLNAQQANLLKLSQSHSLTHSILTHAFGLLEALPGPVPKTTSALAVTFALLWYGMGTTARPIEADLEDRLRASLGLKPGDTFRAKCFVTNALNDTSRLHLGD